MIAFKQQLSILLCGLVIGVSAANLLSVKNWRSFPEGMTCSKDGNAIRFDSGNREKQMFPLCHIPAGALGKVRALRFDIKYSFQDASGKFISAVLLYSKSQKKNIRFPFQVKSPNVWQTVAVDLKHPDVDMAELRYWQFLFANRNPNLTVMVKNIRCLDETGKVIDSLSRNESEVQKPFLAPIGAPDSFAALPNAAHEYLFAAGELKDGQKIGWRITDVSGKKTVVQGSSAVKDRQWKVCVSLPVGFYELHADETEQIFGISILNVPRNASDPFLSLAALLYTTPAEPQESCLRFLEKHHINCIRDWTMFNQLHPAPGVYRNGRDTLYRRMAEHRLQSIYAFSNFPSWQKPIAIRINPCALPRTLLGLATALLTMYDQRRASAVMFQTLNEFDNFSIPSECFMAPIRAAAWAMRDRSECLLGGAEFCTPAGTPAFSASMENHMLDYIDVFALHVYRAPEEALERVEGYRKAMQKHPRKAWMPIWITESGKPWERGRDSKDGSTYSSVVNNHHPRVEEDLQSALWITANAVEAKTMGVERFFPFTMAFFQENNSNFGMMDYHRTPLRSLHCYCFAADLLAGKEYAGDPASPSRTLNAEHVFRGKDESVVVFYAGKDSHKQPDCETDVSRFPAGKGFSMTGAELESKNGTLRFQGGLAYWVFPTAKLDMKSLNTATRNMALLQGAKSYRKVPRVSSPVIPRYKFWQSKTPHYNQFVHFLEGEKCVFQLTNLDGREQEFHPAVTLPEGVSLRNKLPEKIVLPPRSEKDLILEINPGKADSFTVRLADSRDPLSSITVPLVAVGNLRVVTIDCIEKPERWRPNSAGTQQITFDKTRKALKVYTNFRNKKDPEASHWSYPELNLSDSEKSSNLVAVSFDLMIDPVCYNVNAQKWHMLQAGSKQSGADYFPCIGVSDQWKSFTMYISGKEPRTLIRIGMATEAQDLTYYIRNVKFHYGN